MKADKKQIIYRHLIWDYDIPVTEIDALFQGKVTHAGHYTKQQLFGKLLETYPWFTILQLFTIQEIREMLTNEVIKNLRMPSLRKKYGFIKKRLQEIIPVTG